MGIQLSILNLLTLLDELSKSELLFEPPERDDLADENNSRFFLATIVPVVAPVLPVAEAAPLPVPPPIPPPPSVEEEL